MRFMLFYAGTMAALIVAMWGLVIILISQGHKLVLWPLVILSLLGVFAIYTITDAYMSMKKDKGFQKWKEEQDGNR